MSDDETEPLPAAPGPARKSRPSPSAIWRSRRVRVGVALAAVVALVVSTALAFGGPTPSIPTSLTRLGGRPVAVAVGEHAVWVAGPDGKLWKVSPSTGKATQHRSVGKVRPSAVVAGAGGVWVVGPGSPWVWRFSASPFKAEERIRVGGPPFGVAAGPKAVWVTIPEQHEVDRIDPRTKHVVAKVTIAAMTPRTVVVAGKVVWVADPGVAVARIDAKKNRVVKVIQLKAGKAPTGTSVLSCAMAVGEGAVWVANPDGTVSRIDPSKDTVLGSIEVGGRPAGIAAAGGSVWVTDAAGDILGRIDPTTNRVTAAVPVGSGAACVGATAKAVWVANSADGTLTHVG